MVKLWCTRLIVLPERKKCTMQRWIRKALLVTFSIVTLGMVAPPPALTMQEIKSNEPTKRDVINHSSVTNDHFSFEKETIEESILNVKSSFIHYALEKAETQSIEKFGSKIAPIIESEFYHDILPQIEAVISHVAEDYPEEALHSLEVTEKPSGGTSEKIFHIYDKTTGKDIIRFHVRRDQPPHEGYWFNFHYHTHHDNFQSHHQLGDIYWSKNTPPQWLS